uniref:Uncharacterized protein n=1 Tax=Bionectria ochroleuca TaxID=29856 RepID=A0A8H7NF15_BIOOC
MMSRRGQQNATQTRKLSSADLAASVHPVLAGQKKPHSNHLRRTHEPTAPHRLESSINAQCLDREPLLSLSYQRSVLTVASDFSHIIYSMRRLSVRVSVSYH